MISKIQQKGAGGNICFSLQNQRIPNLNCFTVEQIKDAMYDTIDRVTSESEAFTTEDEWSGKASKRTLHR